MELLTTIATAFLLIFGSAICSGLNVALLSLDLRDVKRKAKLGDTNARKALPIRKNVHFYLSGILLTNVAFASATSVVLSDAFSGIVSVLLSTMLLVTFAEITPQALAVSRALHVVAFFSTPIRIITTAAYPITKPLDILLDRIVGKTVQPLHSRHELGLLISEHVGSNSELDEDEIVIVRQALLLSEKKVRAIMTPISKIFHLYEDSKIDGKMIDKLKSENWSRIPIFNRSKTECKSFLMMKDLVDIDFDDHPWSVMDLPRHKAVTIGSMTALDTLFRKFIDAKRHMLIVERDDKIAGVVTIEDLLEEIIGHEIEDEGDE